MGHARGLTEGQSEPNKGAKQQVFTHPRSETLPPQVTIMAVLLDPGQESNTQRRKTTTISVVFCLKEKHTDHAIWEIPR
jgi:hypothetical protein